VLKKHIPPFAIGATLGTPPVAEKGPKEVIVPDAIGATLGLAAVKGMS
jgi:hypothetical protein